jgi:hypothetical protein
MKALGGTEGQEAMAKEEAGIRAQHELEGKDKGKDKGKDEGKDEGKDKGDEKDDSEESD